jgi:hypothetical protein
MVLVALVVLVVLEIKDIRGRGSCGYPPLVQGDIFYDEVLTMIAEEGQH